MNRSQKLSPYLALAMAWSDPNFNRQTIKTRLYTSTTNIKVYMLVLDRYDSALIRPKSECALQNHNVRQAKPDHERYLTALYFDSRVWYSFSILSHCLKKIVIVKIYFNFLFIVWHVDCWWLMTNNTHIKKTILCKTIYYLLNFNFCSGFGYNLCSFDFSIILNLLWYLRKKIYDDN